jgi:cytoskeletal protein CcmA (bactofilin family)
MWRKTDGKASSEVPHPPPVNAAKSEVTSEPPAVSVAPVASTPPPVPREIVPEPPVPSTAQGTSKILAGLKIHGEISGNSDLYIDGELQGKIRLGSASVVIGPSGKVQADIEAGAITIDGSVQGNLKATESVRLGPGSRVQGSVLTPRIGIDDGARLRGKVEMVKAGSSSSPSAPSGAVQRNHESEVSRSIAASAKAE